jgi:hypothetical protein
MMDFKANGLVDNSADMKLFINGKFILWTMFSHDVIKNFSKDKN